jgi:hypothetical protein
VSRPLFENDDVEVAVEGDLLHIKVGDDLGCASSYITEDEARRLFERLLEWLELQADVRETLKR